MEQRLDDNGTLEGLRERLVAAAEAMPRRTVEALQAAADDIRVRVDSGPGGLGHIRTGRLNESLHGEGPNAVEVLDADRFAVTIGSDLRYAAIQASRFKREGPLVPIDPAAVREIVDEEVMEPLREEFS